MSDSDAQRREDERWAKEKADELEQRVQRLMKAEAAGVHAKPGSLRKIRDRIVSKGRHRK